MTSANIFDFIQGKADIYSSDSAEDSERDRVRKGKLGRLAQRRFECMLRGLTSTREKIARGMAFALEHADAAVAVSFNSTTHRSSSVSILTQ